MKKRLKIATVLLLAPATPTLVLSQPVREPDGWQPIIWNLQACVRSNARFVRAAGIHATNDAVRFFANRCEQSLVKDATSAEAGPIPAGRLRKAIEDQWNVLKSNDISSGAGETPMFSQRAR